MRAKLQLREDSTPKDTQQVIKGTPSPQIVATACPCVHDARLQLNFDCDSSLNHHEHALYLTACP
jgi:hypothetical protein